MQARAACGKGSGSITPPTRLTPIASWTSCFRPATAPEVTEPSTSTAPLSAPAPRAAAAALPCCGPQALDAHDRAGHMTLKRRDVFMHAMSAVCLGPWLSAAVPGQARAESDFLSWVFAPAPEPVRFPRKAMDQVFAVLLMRASYDAADDLDFVPMDTFQKEFWLFRQAEQQGYNLSYSPLKPRLGDLTDPLYFDFISFAQYATIAREMAQGQQVFKEFCVECPEQSIVVRRNPEDADNATLPDKFRRRVGDKLYDGLLNGFREEQFGAPPPLARATPVNMQQLTTAVQALLDVMVGRGYALSAQVDAVEAAPEALTGEALQFRVSIQGPVNLWALAALKFRRSPLLNCYSAYVVDAYLRASGLSATYDLSLSEVGVQQLWTLQA